MPSSLGTSHPQSETTPSVRVIGPGGMEALFGGGRAVILSLDRSQESGIPVPRQMPQSMLGQMGLYHLVFTPKPMVRQNASINNLKPASNSCAAGTPLPGLVSIVCADEDNGVEVRAG